MPGGSGARSPIGGGGPGNQAGDPGSELPPKDESKTSPPAQDVENPFGDADVAPKGAEAPLGGLADALKDAATAKELEERTGMTKEQIEQFVKDYEKPKVGAGREGKEVEVKVGAQPAAAPASNLPGLGTQKTSTDQDPQSRRYSPGCRPRQQRGQPRRAAARVPRTGRGLQDQDGAPEGVDPPPTRRCEAATVGREVIERAGTVRYHSRLAPRAAWAGTAREAASTASLSAARFRLTRRAANLDSPRGTRVIIAS